MKRSYLIIILFVFLHHVSAENPISKDYYFPTPINMPLTQTKYDQNNITNFTHFFKLKNYQSRYNTINSFQFQAPNYLLNNYLEHQTNQYSILSLSNPKTFGKYSGKFNEHLFWYAYAEHELLPGMALNNKISNNLIYQPNYRLNIILSTQFYKTQQGITQYQDIQFNGSMSYKLTPYLKLSSFGSYSLNGRQNYYNGVMPVLGYNAGYNGIGATVDLRLINTDYFEIWVNSGMEYLFNPEKNKFEWTPIIVPEIVFK